MDQDVEPEGQWAPKFIANCDQESWVQARIHDAVRMALELHQARGAAANEGAYRLGLHGIIQGTAIEIIRTLGGEPAFVNLPDAIPDGGPYSAEIRSASDAPSQNAR